MKLWQWFWYDAPIWVFALVGFSMGFLDSALVRWLW